MGQSPAVLLLDDGELDDIQGVLDEAKISYGRVRGGAIAQQTPAPRRLLVTTPRRIQAVELPDELKSQELMRIVVVNEDSPTLRAHLREVGFDYLVRRPVHKEALRLLLFHCIYQGEERRAEPRVPVGFEISFRTGLLPRRATLADLSTRGCRILSKWGLEPGKRITVTIPQRAGVPESISVKGRVVRMSLDESLGADGPYSSAVQFDSLAAEVRHELEWILEERARGPATLNADGTPSADPADGGALDSPETRDAGGMSHGFSVEVDVRMDAETAERLDEPTIESPPRAEPEPLLGPATTRGSGETQPVESAAAAPAGELSAEDVQPPAADEATGAERREHHRGSYELRVPAFGDRAMRVLVARDLSMRGMRIEKDNNLEVGDRLHLAIYGDAEEEPFLVWATVDRDDGDSGMALVFDEVHPVIAEQLEKVVANLPAVESLHDDEAKAMGTVVTEILES